MDFEKDNPFFCDEVENFENECALISKTSESEDDFSDFEVNSNNQGILNLFPLLTQNQFLKSFFSEILSLSSHSTNDHVAKSNEDDVNFRNSGLLISLFSKL
jgi:hypothetical protein